MAIGDQNPWEEAYRLGSAADYATTSGSYGVDWGVASWTVITVPPSPMSFTLHTTSSPIVSTPTDMEDWNIETSYTVLTTDPPRRRRRRRRAKRREVILPDGERAMRVTE